MALLRVSSGVLLALTCACGVSGKAPGGELRASPSVSSGGDGLWSAALGRPELLAGRFDAPGATAEEAARGFLVSRAAALGLADARLSLELALVKRGRAGQYLRFTQRHLGLPVFEGEVVVLVAGAPGRFQVRAVTLAQRERAALVREAGDVGEAKAEAAALAAVGAVAPFSWGPRTVRGVHVPAGPQATPRLAYRVRVSTDEPPRAWEVLVDAASGAALAQRDRRAFVNGSGHVFDPNPVTTTGDVGLRDNSDATSVALDGARFQVTLPRLDGSGFTRGSYVDARTRQAASRLNVASLAFDFRRDESPSFEQVNVYYHLDRVQDRFQADLRFTDVNNRVQEAVADGQTSDNSYFDPNSGLISYGRGGVDDAEDADIVVHEYGHAVLHDQVPSWGNGGDTGAMGEGFGDYLAASTMQVLGARASRPALVDARCVGEWDATAYSRANPPCLRRVDTTKHYPEGETGEVHDDGEMWSAALWGVRELLGADVTDTLVLEAQFLLAGTATFEQASAALLTADQNLHQGANADVLRRRLVKQGVSRRLSAVTATGTPLVQVVSLDNRRDGTGNYPADLDETVSFTVPGAAALSVHFTRVDLEVDRQCLASSCDNVYLSNADGDLFEVVSGAATNLSSNPIAGDTVRIRLVTDPSVGRFGYHVDRLDAWPPTDGGTVTIVDAGVPPAADAGAPDAGGTGDGGAAADGGADGGGETVAVPLLTPELGRVGKASGCGCSGAGGAELLGGALLLLALLRRRRGV